MSRAVAFHIYETGNREMRTSFCRIWITHHTLPWSGDDCMVRYTHNIFLYARMTWSFSFANSCLILVQEDHMFSVGLRMCLPRNCYAPSAVKQQYVKCSQSKSTGVPSKLKKKQWFSWFRSFNVGKHAQFLLDSLVHVGFLLLCWINCNCFHLLSLLSLLFLRLQAILLFLESCSVSFSCDAGCDCRHYLCSQAQNFCCKGMLKVSLCYENESTRGILRFDHLDIFSRPLWPSPSVQVLVNFLSTKNCSAPGRGFLQLHWILHTASKSPHPRRAIYPKPVSKTLNSLFSGYMPNVLIMRSSLFLILPTSGWSVFIS